MRLKPISAKEAEKLTKKLGYCWTPDGCKTYYATNDEESDVWEYDTKAKRDNAIRFINGKEN